MKYLKIKDNVNPEQLLQYGFEKGTMYYWNEPIDYLFYKGEKGQKARSGGGVHIWFEKKYFIANPNFFFRSI